MASKLEPVSAVAHSFPVNIGHAAGLSGVSAKMLRHYESLGLLGRVTRTGSGYRQYSEADVHTLRFIKRSRDLGFSMVEIGELVSLWRNRRRASASVKRIAQQHVHELATRIEAMQAMQRTLQNLLQHCHGDERPDCPILDDLASRSGGGATHQAEVASATESHRMLPIQEQLANAPQGLQPLFP